MRPLRRLIVSVACVLAGSLPAIAVEPDDLPWEDLNNPGIQDTNTGDADPADPIGNLINQTTPDAETAATPSDVDNDRLEALKPLLEPSPAVAAPAATPDAPTAPAPETKTVMKPQPPEPPEPPAIAPLPQAQPAPATAQGQFQPAQSAPAAPAQPAVPLAAPPATAPVPAAIEAPPAQMATPAAPQPAPPATAPAAQPAPDAPATVEAAPPAETPVAAPAPLATPSASQPDPMAVAQPVQPAPAAPPAADQPAAAATAAATPADGKIYLPLKRYFEANAEAQLKIFDAADRSALVQFYDARMGEAMWVTKSGFNPAGQSLIDEIGKASDWGLSSDDYKVPGLTRIGEGAFSEDDLADAEIKLSLVAMEYARHARGDRIDTPAEQLSSYIDRKPQLIERPKLLEALVAAPDKAAYLRGLHPQHPQFERLRQKLIALRTNTEEEFEKIPDGPKITPGKSHWQIGLIRKRLKVPSPGLKPDGTAADANFYDRALADAVVRFKEGAQVTPVNTTITPDLRKALNVDNRGDERSLLANMEAWRWMPDDLGALHIFVNVPEFLVRVVKDSTIIHEERVVTGRPETQTPIFSDMMRTVVFQPDWKVPESIKINELLPKLRAGSNPIESQGLVIKRNGRTIDAWDVDWNRQDIRNYYVYQPPGDSNVLGVVKFLFPNKHSVYLHDTPSKRLFNEKVRTFSHGCMRVRNPVRLAEVIMAEDKGWEADQVRELVSSGPEDNDISLDKPIPVHVTYFTYWVTDSGELKKFGDVYGHEQRIKLGLEGRWGEIVKNRDHLLPPQSAPVARGRDDWGDSEPAPRLRSYSRPQRYTYRQEPRYQYLPPPKPQYAPPAKKRVKGVGDMISDILGGF